MDPYKEKIIIIGAGPCGMSCAIELQKQGLDPLVIEKENVVHTLHQFPTHQTFFSSSDKLEIGDIPFITEKQKPVRNEALVYYRNVAKRTKLRLNTFETVISMEKDKNTFYIYTVTGSGAEHIYEAAYVIVATGYYDQHNRLNVKGENLTKVMHYFKESHPYFQQDVAIIGGKNSAVDAALELHAAGANVTVLYRQETYSSSIKPWILPNFEALVNKGEINMIFNANVEEITDSTLTYQVNGHSYSIPNDFVFAMIGYKPNVEFMKSIGIDIHSDSGKPDYNDSTYETNISGVYIAGVVAAGYNNNKIFIENGRLHGKAIAESIAQKEAETQ